MPLRKETDENVRKRLDTLIEGFENLIDPLRQAEIQTEFYSNSVMDDMIELDINVGNSPNVIEFHRFTRSADRLIQTILGEMKAQQFLEEFYGGGRAATSERYLGFLKSLKDDYEAGLLDDLSRIIETDMANELIELMEYAQGSKLQQKFARLLKAFTAGVILEDALRRLCQRQSPPLEIIKEDGEPMTLNPLITQLQKADVFNKSKGDQLRSWAKIRNFASHANFTELERSDVDQMVLGVKAFLGEI